MIFASQRCRTTIWRGEQRMGINEMALDWGSIFMGSKLGVVEWGPWERRNILHMTTWIEIILTVFIFQEFSGLRLTANSISHTYIYNIHINTYIHIYIHIHAYIYIYIIYIYICLHNTYTYIHMYINIPAEFSPSAYLLLNYRFAIAKRHFDWKKGSPNLIV